MTAHIYPAAAIGFQNETLDWTAEEIKAVFLGPSFSYDGSLVYLDQLPSQHIIAISDAMENPEFDNGQAVAGPAAFLQLLSTQEITHVVLFQDTGDPAYSPLLVHYDSDSIIGAPKTSTGEDQFVYYLSPPGYFFQFSSEELVGPIDTHVLAEELALGELEGGVTVLFGDVFLGSRLTVSTHAVCVPAEEGDDCCEPTIRSSQCA